MIGGGVYRESSFMICPRCGELLDLAFDDVYACLRCNGIWVSAPTLALAFGDPAWPAHARTMWWRSALPCPECSRLGSPSTLAAQLCDGVHFDRCSTHGMWLDPGELGRLASTTGDELAELRRRLRGDGADVDRIEQRRSAWRRDLEARRRSAEEYEAWLAEDKTRQIERAEAREREARLRDAVERRDDADRDAKRRVMEELHKSRAELLTGIDTAEAELVALRNQLRAVEARLEGDRMKLRALDVRLEELDRELSAT